MKRYFWPVITLLVLFATSCQQEVGLEKEKEAILAVLQEEAAAVAASDFDRFRATHVQDGMETRVELGIYGYNIYQGWEEVGTLMKDYLEGNQMKDPVNRKENVRIKVSGHSAWLTCDNIWNMGSGGSKTEQNNLLIVFLEKIEGKWKISFAAYYSKPEPVEGVNESFY